MGAQVDQTETGARGVAAFVELVAARPVQRLVLVLNGQNAVSDA